MTLPLQDVQAMMPNMTVFTIIISRRNTYEKVS